MATFKADNIETDDESDDELDDTKEIQIEEALKVYQTAVKLQSQGKAFLKETADAYKTLFESDVFAYPESWSEYRRVQTYGEHLYDPIPWQDEQIPKAITSTATGVENAPSTLPQVLHLSYKNRAQHYLDAVRATLDLNPAPQHVRTEISKALDDFTEALDKDEDDVDLWRRAAKIGQVLKSHRISRYCLETVVEGDEQGTDETLGDAGMEVKLAEHDLEQITQDLDDDVWRKQAPAADIGLPPLWRKQLSLYSYLPDTPERSPAYDGETIEIQTERSWRAVGEEIYQRLVAEQQGSTNAKPEAPWKITVPEKMSVSDRQTLLPLKTEIQVKPQENEEEQSAVTSPDVMSSGADIRPAEELPQDVNAAEQAESMQPPATLELPTRKRSSEAAELPEEPEGGRIRSKRIRARESIAGDAQQNEIGLGNAGSGFDEKIQASMEADEWLSDVLAAILEKIGVDDIRPAKPYRDMVAPSNTSAIEQSVSDLRLGTAVKDFYNTMQNWTGARTKKLVQPGRSRDTSAEARSSGLSVFLEHSSTNRQKVAAEDFDSHLEAFLDSINSAEMCTVEVAFEWICSLLCSPSGAQLGASSYVLDFWPTSLKETFVKMVVDIDDMLSDRFRVLFDRINDLSSVAERESKPNDFRRENLVLLDVSQSLFEMHLDIYVDNTHPDGKTDEVEKLQQRVRLNKWSALARDVINLHLDARLWNAADVDEPQLQRLQFRHLWASVHQLKVLEDVEREHLLLCIEDLKKEISAFTNLVIELPNSAVMPELSVAAADDEISKLETMDFFIGIFDKEGKAPVDLIESLEPLLEQTMKSLGHEIDHNNTESGQPGEERSLKSSAQTTPIDPSEGREQSRSTFQILTTFLESASTPLRLSLWNRLLESYEAIQYPPKVFSIHLSCIHVIMHELISTTYAQKTQEEREDIVLDSLRDLRELLKNALDLTSDTFDAFECLDIDHLKVSIRAVTDLWTLLYAVGLFDDYSQAGGKGGSSVNPFRNYPLGSFHAASVKLHDMQIQTSMLLYKLIREAMKQMPEDFPNTDEVKLDYLRHMHYQFGVRRICKACDSSFLRFMQEELMSLPSLGQQSSTDLAQVLYDLYDLNCFSSASDRQDHGCDADYLDRKTAMQLIDFVMDKASRVSVKDLLKSDLGKSMEKLHSTLGMVKSNFAALRNRKFYTAYLKSPIQPLQLFRSLHGIADISVVPVSPEEGIIASKGWYLLKGQISLAKYKAQRAKVTAGLEDDLNDAIAFFMQDLEFDSERWETWYRMAQARDGLLEESILWSAERLNNKQSELAELQRETIHTYLMATAVANRAAEPSQETTSKLSEMYTDFAVCIYSATRQPFVMRAFSIQDVPSRHFSNSASGGGEYTRKPFAGLTRRTAWKFAIALLNRAAKYSPNKWVIHYMLGKCLWKIHTRSDRLEDSRIAVQKAFSRAIETLPERKDPNRHEPILEPIYKLVSITHKLVQRKELDPEQGSSIFEEILQKQKQIDVSKRPRFAESQSWSVYVIDMLKMLRAADKSRWHHRLVVRAAQMINEQSEENGGGARAAKDYLIEQHIYSTKTYALTVWKPEHERSGRHWVYTQQYAQFLTSLLAATNDVEGIQLLAKRVRKKPNDFYEHAPLWEYVCEKHVAVHRRYGNIRHDCADAVFKHLDQEEFAKRAELIDKWISTPQNTDRLYEVLRETAELKKLNAALVKPTAIDDLLADTYAEIWVHFGSSLEAAPETAKALSDPVPPPAAAETPESPPKEERRNVMSLTNLMNLDGSTDARASQPATPTPSQPDHTTTRSKPRLISMREIIKRANDAIILSKPAPKAATPPPKVALQQSDTSNIRVVIPQKAEQEAGDGDGDANSAPASVHDDADDESELSEISDAEIELEAEPEAEADAEDAEDDDDDDDDEEETSPVVVMPLFPNLHRRSPGTSPSPDAEGSVAEKEGVESERMDVD